MEAYRFIIDVGYDDDNDTVEWTRINDHGSSLDERETAILREAITHYDWIRQHEKR